MLVYGLVHQKQVYLKEVYIAGFYGKTIFSYSIESDAMVGEHFRNLLQKHNLLKYVATTYGCLVPSKSAAIFEMAYCEYIRSYVDTLCVADTKKRSKLMKRFKLLTGKKHPNDHMPDEEQKEPA